MAKIRTVRLLARPWACALAAFLSFAPGLRGQYVPPYVIVQGTLMNAGGTAAANATLTFTPSQTMFVGGTGVVVTASQCSTDVNGTVVGLPNPVSGPTVAASLTSGTLPANNYYVVFAWYDQFGKITLVSPEVTRQLSMTGELTITPPAGSGPPPATGMVVYIGTSPGAETFQGYTASTTGSYVQSVPLVTTGGSTWALTGLVYGASTPPTMNLTACRVVANDAAWPTGTGYTVSLVDASGNTLFNYPAMWQLLGPGSTYNLSNGLPYYHGQVTYPVPILTIPYNHNPQSVSGPLAMGQTGGATYPIYSIKALGVGTASPAWGLDIEGSGLLAMANAADGYLVNGSGGTEGQCLGSDGTAYDTPVNCLTSATLHYQTVASAGTAEPQEPELNFAAGPWTLTDTSGTSTNVALNVQGTDAKLATTASGGTSGHCVQWDAQGGLSDAGAACTSASQGDYYFKTTGCAINNSGNLNSCYGTITFTAGGNTTPSFPAMPDTSYEIFCTVDTGTTSSASFSVHGSTNSGNTPAFTRTTTGFDYVWTEVMSNGAGGSAAPVIDCHLHHS